MSDTPETDGPDEASFSMFGDAEMGPKTVGYQVLARKYRPRLFEDLIGQEAMVRTLSNAFETGRVAHAFMLTGVRGVGKTTTARLLARGLNYKSDSIDTPSISLDPPGEDCAAIMEGRHPDVLELDAASRTGVADMRDLLDGVRYSPVSARYKVYIIDEVHMLSTAAFNALLKTLEEPPEHVKFIFATTEIRKVPVTVLSRCQRFDLKRLDTDGLTKHLARIAGKEGASVSEEGLALIARASEGSVRDALSILDQAIVQNTDDTDVTAETVRDMLGLADRTRLLDVFGMAVTGDGKGALTEIADLVHVGADPLVVLKDLLDVCADVATVQAAGDDWAPRGPAEWAKLTKDLTGKVSPAQIARYWQILLSGYRDTQTAPDAGTALNMVVLRLSAAASLPSPEEAAKMIADGKGVGAVEAPGKPEAQLGTSATAQTELASLEDIVALLDAHREAILSGEVSAYVQPSAFAPGKIVCATKDGAPVGILRRLTNFLEDVTGEDWQVERAEEAGETLNEARARKQAASFADVAANPGVQAVMAALPGAKIVDVQDVNTVEDTDTGDNVVPIETARKG
ncbi:MAG: DNA polymerase III subunit gamma/tau [Hyphomonadaceae bacterium]